MVVLCDMCLRWAAGGLKYSSSTPTTGKPATFGGYCASRRAATASSFKRSMHMNCDCQSQSHKNIYDNNNNNIKNTTTTTAHRVSCFTTQKQRMELERRRIGTLNKNENEKKKISNREESIYGCRGIPITLASHIKSDLHQNNNYNSDTEYRMDIQKRRNMIVSLLSISSAILGSGSSNLISFVPPPSDALQYRSSSSSSSTSSSSTLSTDINNDGAVSSYVTDGIMDAYSLYTDRIDNYCLQIPKTWIKIDSAGQDVFFRSTMYKDTNLFVDILIAKNVENVRELGSVSSVATSIRDNVSGELQSTRIGVMRKTTLISAAARTKRQQEIYFTDRVSKNDSGDTQNAMDATYYDVILNAKSFASNNAMAVDPSERPVALEWDRRLICVLGVADDKLITLRVQVPEAFYKGNPKGSTVVDEVDNIVKSFSVGNIL